MSTITIILCAFFGGALATALGALGSVILCAIVAIAGICAVAGGCEFNIVTEIAFGFFLSPHLGLGPAACALGYAAKKGYVDDSKNIALPLLSLGKPDVLVVGGLFAVLAYYIQIGLANGLGLQGRFDNVSFTIVVINIIAKLMFGDEGLMGKIPEGDKRFGVNSPNSWFPWQHYGNSWQYFIFAGSMAGISTYLWWLLYTLGEKTGNMNLMIDAQFPGFALAVTVLLLLCAGLPCPVFHHVGLVSAYAAMTAYGFGASLPVVMLWGISWGILSHFVADWGAKAFFVYGRGYVDPPSISMASCSLFIYIIFPAIGLYNGVMLIATPAIMLVLLVIMCFFIASKRNKAA